MRKVSSSSGGEPDNLRKMQDLAVELASLPAGADLYHHLAVSLRQLTGALAVTAGEYRPESRDIVLRHLDAGNRALAVAGRILGYDVGRVVSPVDEATYRLILEQRIGHRESLTEVTFGAVPPRAARMIQRLFDVDRFVGLAYVYQGKLYGTSVLAFARSAALPSTALLQAFASLAAVSLRRHLAERGLRAADERLRGVTENLPAVVFRFHARESGESGLSYMSESCERLFGVPVEPLGTLLQRLTACIVPEDRAAFESSVIRAVSSRRPWEFEGRLRRPDGELLWLKGRSQPMLVDGELVYNGLILDVSESKRAEAAAREHRDLVEAVVETSQDWIWTLGVDGRHTYSNPAVERILGYRPDEFVGQDLDLVHEEDRGRLQEVLRESIARKRGWTNTWARWRARDGQYRILESNAVPVLGPDGEITGFRGVDRDITERMRSAQEIEEWKRRYDRLAQAAGNVIYDSSSATGTIVWGGGVASILGYDPAELAGGMEQWKALIHEEDREETVRAFELAEAAGARFRAEYRFRCRNGQYRTVEDTGYPLLDESGGVERYIGVLVDVTDRRNAEAEHRKLEEQLRQAQKMESIGRLAGGVAHDFNNLLSVINGYADLMLRELREGDPHREYLEELQAAGTRAASLTQQLLAFSRKQILQPRRMDINQVVRALQPMLGRLLGEDIELVLALEPRVPAILADPHQIEQVIMNLVVNSRDAMPGGGSLTIVTEVSPAADAAPAASRVILSISDSGIGMDEATRLRVFEPFFTTKEVGKGTGLGLSTVQGIVAQSGGTIDVESELGRGSTFRIGFPSAAPLSEQTAGEEPRTRRLEGKGKILVVEDEPSVRAYVAAALRSFGYTVDVAESATEALRVFEGSGLPYDLVVTDVVMPGMGGVKLAGRLEQLAPGVKIVFMSGYTDDAVVDQGPRRNGTGFLQKPFSPEELAAAVQDLLGR